MNSYDSGHEQVVRFL